MGCDHAPLTWARLVWTSPARPAPAP